MGAKGKDRAGLSASALAWGAARSGLSYADFVAALDAEQEARLQREYDAWRVSKGLAVPEKPKSKPRRRRPYVPTGRAVSNMELYRRIYIRKERLENEEQ